MKRTSILVFLIIIMSRCTSPEKDWLLIYYMPYDNDLSAFTDEVIGQLYAIKNPSLAIAVQSDTEGLGGMTRYLFSGEDSLAVHVEAEDSYSLSSLDSYIEWVTTKVSAKHVALIFLDHGGDLDETGLDEYPETGKFMGIGDIVSAMENMNRLRERKTDLLFFQVCAKASIEPLYEFRNVAEYSMASQNLLGAPNYYYLSLAEINQETEVTELAELITEGERKDMYYSLSLINNTKWDDLIRELEQLSLDDLPSGDPNSVKLINYWDNTYIDLMSFIEYYTSDTIKTTKVKYALDQLVMEHYINPADPRMEDHCGLNILSPWDPSQKEHAHLELIKMGMLQKMAEKIRADH